MQSQKCYKAAYGWGYEWVENGYCDAYNIGQNVGTEAGPNYSIPLSVHGGGGAPKGDMENPKRRSATRDPRKREVLGGKK